MDVRRVLGIIKNMKKVDKDVALNITNRIEELVPARVQSMPLELFLLFSVSTTETTVIENELQTFAYPLSCNYCHCFC